MKGKVIGTDARTDLAILKINGANPFPALKMGDSSKMRVGDWVLAVGSPFGLEQSVTSGIVSAIRQSLVIEGRSFRDLIQTDAAINRGNSGGPLVNMHAELIGVNTAIYAPTGVFSGIGFAVPSNAAKSVLKELIQKGFVERSWMGVEIAEVNDVIAQQFGLGKARGALVNQVVPSSPAEKAGLRRGDIILEFDGKRVESVQNLQDTVSAATPDTKVDVEVWRDGKPKDIHMKIARLPKSEEGGYAEAPADEPVPTPKGTEWMGAVVADIQGAIKKELPDEEGVIVLDVPPGSDAAEVGLREGDIIHGVNRDAVTSEKDIKKVTPDLKRGVVIDIVRRGQAQYLTYRRPQ
jgi:serine protease Do